MIALEKKDINSTIMNRVASGMDATLSVIEEATSKVGEDKDKVVEWVRSKNYKAYEKAIRGMMIDPDRVFYWRFVNGLRVKCLDGEPSYTEPVSIMMNDDESSLEVVLSPFFYKLSKQSQKDAIEHEVLHRALAHDIRAGALPDESTASVAADLAVNSFIDPVLATEDGIEIEPHSPSDYGLRLGDSMEQYFKMIYEDNKNKRKGQQSMDMDDNSDSDEDDKEGGGGGGGEGGEDDDDQQGDNESGGGGSSNEDDSDDEQDDQSGHDNQDDQDEKEDDWPNFDEFKDKEQDSHPQQQKSQDVHPWARRKPTNIENSLVEGRMEEAEKSIGNLPDELRTKVKAARPSKKRSWILNVQTKLYDDRRSKGVWRLSYRRDNRRDDKGIWPGRRRKEMPKVAVAIDTSGSMPDEILQEIINALPHLDRQARIGHVVQCDCHIHYNELYDPTDLDTLYGRGGTSFHPVIEWLNDDMIGRRYSYVFYFTDGEGQPIEDQEVREDLNVIWIDTSGREVDEYANVFMTGTVFQLTDIDGRPLSQNQLRY